MPSVFISYSRRREQVVQTLIGDIEGLGHAVWFDKELTGGKPWWDGILAQIRNCEVFVLAVSPETLESKACKREWRYAADLGKTILPVLITQDVSPDALPARLQAIQSVDYRNLDRAAALALARAFNTLPPSPQLPSPLPAAPEVPISDLATLRDLIDSDAALTQAQQTEIVAKLRRLTREPGTSVDALNLLRAMKVRSDLFADTDDDIEELLKGQPNIATPPVPQPQPQPQAQPAPAQVKAESPRPTFARRMTMALAFAILGVIFGAACVAFFVAISGIDPFLRPERYQSALVTAAGGGFLGFASAGRLKLLVWPMILGLVVAVPMALNGPSFLYSLGNMLAAIQPLVWIVVAIVQAIVRRLRPVQRAVAQ